MISFLGVKNYKEIFVRQSKSTIKPFTSSSQSLTLNIFFEFTKLPSYCNVCNILKINVHFFHFFIFKLTRDVRNPGQNLWISNLVKQYVFYEDSLRISFNSLGNNNHFYTTFRLHTKIVSSNNSFCNDLKKNWNTCFFISISQKKRRSDNLKLPSSMVISI